MSENTNTPESFPLPPNTPPVPEKYQEENSGLPTPAIDPALGLEEIAATVAPPSTPEDYTPQHRAIEPSSPALTGLRKLVTKLRIRHHERAAADHDADARELFETRKERKHIVKVQLAKVKERPSNPRDPAYVLATHQERRIAYKTSRRNARAVKRSYKQWRLGYVHGDDVGSDDHWDRIRTGRYTRAERRSERQGAISNMRHQRVLDRKEERNLKALRGRDTTGLRMGKRMVRHRHKAHEHNLRQQDLQDRLTELSEQHEQKKRSRQHQRASKGYTPRHARRT